MMFLVALLALNKYRSLYGLSTCAVIGGATYLLLSYLDETEGFAALDNGDSDQVSGTSSAATSSAASVSAKSPTNKSDTAESLMPNEKDKWDGAAPSVGVSLVEANLMQTPASFMGMVLQSNKIANHDLRCAPYIKKSNVAPWMVSTVEADTRRKGAQIVSCEAAEAEAGQGELL